MRQIRCMDCKHIAIATNREPCNICRDLLQYRGQEGEDMFKPRMCKDCIWLSRDEYMCDIEKQDIGEREERVKCQR